MVCTQEISRDLILYKMLLLTRTKFLCKIGKKLPLWQPQSRQSAKLFLQSSGSPIPPPAGECAPPIDSGGGGGKVTLACESPKNPNSDEGNAVLCIYKYFVVGTLYLRPDTRRALAAVCPRPPRRRAEAAPPPRRVPPGCSSHSTRRQNCAPGPNNQTKPNPKCRLYWCLIEFIRLEIQSVMLVFSNPLVN